MARKPRTNPTPTPPAGIGTAAAEWWRSVQSEFGIVDAAGTALLEQAALALDRAERARDVLARDGLSIMDRFGIPRAHPLLPHLRDAESSFRSALRDLRLDVEPARPIGRPCGV